MISSFRKLELQNVLPFIFLGCGDRPGYLIGFPYRNLEWLGNARMEEGKTYKSCAKACRSKYPDFDFYHKLDDHPDYNHNQCECFSFKTKYVPGRKMRFRKHKHLTVGFSQPCGE